MTVKKLFLIQIILQLRANIIKRRKLARIASTAKRIVCKPDIKAFTLKALKLTRYNLVRFLYGFGPSKSIALAHEVEYFFQVTHIESICFAGLPKSKLEKFNQIISEAHDYSLNKKFDCALELLNKAFDIMPSSTVLANSFRQVSLDIYLEIGCFRNLQAKASKMYLRCEIARLEKKWFSLPVSIKIIDESWTGSIGHLGLLANFIQAKKLGMLPPIQYVVHSKYIVNKCFFNYLLSLGEVFDTSKNQFFHILNNIAKPTKENFETWDTNNGLKSLYWVMNKVGEAWQDEAREPLLSITQDHRNRGFDCLQKMGIPQGKWFVSLHVRSGDPGIGNMRQGRNCDINTYIPAIREIVKAGGYIVRMGDNSMEPIQSIPGLIDYPFTPFKSDWMDVFLWACPRFFIGTLSGPNTIPPVFGVPQLLTNATSFGVSSIHMTNSIMLPKLWYSCARDRFLTFAEMLEDIPGWCERKSIGDDLTLVDNTVDELIEAVKEMIALTSENLTIDLSRFSQLAEHPLQKQLNKIRIKYGAFGRLPVSLYFLKKHESLLQLLSW